MPIYTYECAACEHKEDQFRSMKSVEPVEQLMECPSCKGEFFHRIFHIPNVNDGPKTFGTLSEQNIKKYGKPKEALEMEAARKKRESGVLGDVHTKLVKKLGTDPTPERKHKYVMTGE